MKVIRLVTGPSEWRKEVHCERCATVLEVELADLEYVVDFLMYDPFRPHKATSYVRLKKKCPGCGVSLLTSVPYKYERVLEDTSKVVLGDPDP